MKIQIVCVLSFLIQFSMKPSLLLSFLTVILFGCNKQLPAPNGDDSFTLYTIKSGNHHSQLSPYKALEISEMRFVVMFDHSAVYHSIDPENQNDINKLFGFADNEMQHHEYSARFGWRWSDGALRLFAYVYNNSVLLTSELGSFPLNREIHCSIKINSDTYTFKAGEQVVHMSRESTTPLAKGYQLYPYFGGDEPAPQEIRIWIKEE
jgi:hypothetical protein